MFDFCNHLSQNKQDWHVKVVFYLFKQRSLHIFVIL